eukprot:1223607-Alexandrium_andersonii.AAC.1
MGFELDAKARAAPYVKQLNATRGSGKKDSCQQIFFVAHSCGVTRAQAALRISKRSQPAAERAHDR